MPDSRFSGCSWSCPWPCTGSISRWQEGRYSRKSSWRPDENLLHPLHDAARVRVQEAVGLHDAAAINEHLELAEPTLDGLDVDVRFLAQLGCHTGSHVPLDQSQVAEANLHSSHVRAPLIVLRADSFIEGSPVRAASPGPGHRRLPSRACHAESPDGTLRTGRRRAPRGPLAQRLPPVSSSRPSMRQVSRRTCSPGSAARSSG